MAAALELYFYTKEAGLAEIRLFGYIKSVPLFGSDSAYGEGVYGTPVPPSRGQVVAALNNWGFYWKQHHQDNQLLDRAIQLLIPAQRLVMAPSNPSIFIHPGPIEVNQYQWQLYMMPEVTPQNPGPEKGYIEVEDSSDDDDDKEELGDFFCPEGEEEGGGEGDTDSSDSSGDSDAEEITGPEWESWPCGGLWGGQQQTVADPYTAMMYGGYTVEVYEEQSDSDEEDW